MIVTINVPFNLEQICDSGQCFRCDKLHNDIFRFVHLTYVLYIKQINNNQYEVSVSEDEWNSIWTPYFDLNSNYRLGLVNDSFLSNAVKFGEGIRILCQDPFEMLISYIISQQKSIPQIKRAVNNISCKYGQKIVTQYETVYSFPSKEVLSQLTINDLQEFKLGYRTKYIMDALARLRDGSINLERMFSYTTDEIISELKTIKGVGDKISNCVCLFAYHRLECVPKDVWIKRIISEYFNGKNKFEQYASYAGLMQQYAYYYIRRNVMEN